MKHNRLCWALSFLAVFPLASVIAAAPKSSAVPGRPLSWIGVGRDGKSFVEVTSATRFSPWGFNYDHDRNNRLLEQYWDKEWLTVADDFLEMKRLGANTVRIHLQVCSFMNSEQEPNAASLDRLARLVALAEQTGLYLDLTGLGCYLRTNVPPWYNQLSEPMRWKVQARFWEAVSRTCSNSPAVFCYDLMNEPIVTEDKQNRDWTPGEFAGMCFVQRITLDFAGRTPQQIARAWVELLAGAIRKQDQRRLITVGAIPWALEFPGAKPLFYSKDVSRELDFVSLHFYPKTGQVDKALKALAVYDIGKPMVIEEMFPLNCSVGEVDQFIRGSRGLACGWLSFYWGKTIQEYRAHRRDIGEGMMLDWLEYVATNTPYARGGAQPGPTER